MKVNLAGVLAEMKLVIAGNLQDLYVQLVV